MTALGLAMAGVLALGSGIGSLHAADGGAILQSRCIRCHQAGRIQRAEYDRDGWAGVVDRMMGKSNFGVPLSDAEREALLDHLASE